MGHNAEVHGLGIYTEWLTAISAPLVSLNCITHLSIYWLTGMVCCQSFPMIQITVTIISYMSILNSLPFYLTVKGAQQIHVTSLCKSDSDRIQCVTRF